tara:strand:+ start:160 stop:684 length:525 start_codon:yes stop_codon:yes gene_type:complete
MVGDMSGAGRVELLQFLKVAACKHPTIPNLKPTLRDCRQFIRLRKQDAIKKELNELQTWLKAQISAPQLYRAMNTSNTGKQLSSPSMLTLVVSLASKLGQPLSTVWNMRLSECRWVDTALAELDGAELTISYEGEFEDPLQLNDAEAVELARKTLPRAAFNAWLKSRKQNNANI